MIEIGPNLQHIIGFSIYGLLVIILMIFIAYIASKNE